MISIYNEILKKISENKSIVLKSTLKNNKGFLREDMKKEVLEVNNLSDGEIEELKKNGLFSEKKESATEIFEAFMPGERLIILGAGHISLYLAELGVKIGMHTIVIDDRLSFANKNRFPMVDEVICDNFESAIKNLKLTSSDYVVLVTRGHKYDTVCLKTLINEETTKYIGMLGSKRRVILLKKALEEEGYDKEFLESLHAPIGLSIGAITPEEIAVSIIAEIIDYKRNIRKEDLSTNHSNIDTKILELLSKEDDEKKALITIIRASGSVPRREGARMIVYENGNIIGTIGGGCTEGDAIIIAKNLIGTGNYETLEINLSDDLAEEEGMACGGNLTVLIEDVL